MANERQPIPIPQDFRTGVDQMGHPGEVAVLRTMGVEAVVQPERIYSRRNPYNSGRFDLKFTLSSRSSTWDYPTRLLRAAFHDRSYSPILELDDMIEQIEAADSHQKRRELRDKIKGKLAEAYACYGGAFVREEEVVSGEAARETIHGHNMRGQPYLLPRLATREQKEAFKL